MDWQYIASIASAVVAVAIVVFQKQRHKKILTSAKGVIDFTSIKLDDNKITAAEAVEILIEIVKKL